MPNVRLRDGGQLYVRVLGRGQPVLLLHGLGMNSRHWLPYLLPFLHRFRFYLPDFRGAGQSRQLRFNQPDVFQNLMEDVEDVVGHFVLNDFLLIGYSLGGSTALHWLRNSGFIGVRRYLHIDQSPCIVNVEGWRYGLFGESQQDLFDALQQLDMLLAAHSDCNDVGELPSPVRHAAMAIIAGAASRVLGRPVVGQVLQLTAHWPRVLETVMPITRVDDIRAYLRVYRCEAHDYREILRSCAVPITVMIGMRSPLYPHVGQMVIAQHALNANVVKMQKSGHTPFLDEPIRFTRELGLFLEGKKTGG